MISDKTVGRLSVYRRLLNNLLLQGEKSVYSHQLANMAGITAAQVRRDLMVTGYNGNSSRGYEVRKLTESIAKVLDAPQSQNAALIGIGNLGRSILAYFHGRRPKLSIVAAFDVEPEKFDRVIHGCRSYSIEELPEVVEKDNITVGIITVPSSEAQDIADRLALAGVKGILNFAPVPLKVPSTVYVEDVDMTMSLEKVAFFARKNGN